MQNSKRITIFSVLLLSAVCCWPGVKGADSTAADSLRRASLRDSLLRMQNVRKNLCEHSSAAKGPFSYSQSPIFAADNDAPSEVVATLPLCLPVRFGLSSRLSRFLLYGNVAPIAPIFEYGSLLFTTFDQFKGTDDFSTSEFSAITLLPNNGCRYDAFPAEVVVPEGSFLWENGVFGEDVFSVRFMRAISERLSVNVFSNYRHFDATGFSHEGNGVLSLYRSFSPDTTLFTNVGYNPLTNDYTAGIRTRWDGARGSALYLGAKYADCEDGLPFNAIAKEGLPPYLQLHQYRSTLDAGSDHEQFGTFLFDVEARLENAAIVRYKPDSASGPQVRRDAANSEISIAARTSTTVREIDTVSLLYRVQRISRSPFDYHATVSLEHNPELSVSLPFTAGYLKGVCRASAGYLIDALDDSLGYQPSWSASIEGGYGQQSFRLYAMESALPYSIPYDSAFYAVAPLFDEYRFGGGELSLRRGGAGLIIGCQSIEGITESAVRRAWPEGQPPYSQPRLVFLAAPSFGPWHGLSVTSRAFIADRKPLVKAQGALLYSANPKNTREFIDLRLCFDYWSARDTILFAARDDWNRPVYDVNTEVAIQVTTFRFFAKVSNILDRNFAYVPGYYSPGLTFRWGITWFLQR
jgi:hypothetical protein